MTSKSMQAAVLTRYGAPENIEITSIAIPKPKSNEVLVKVYATPVTTADTMMRQAIPPISRLFLGWSRPRNNIMGTGFAGEVVSLGAQVGKFELGDRVFGESGTGFSANAQYVCIDENGVIDLAPNTLTDEEAATIGDGPMTSYHFLKTLGQVQPGQKVLIIGASGSLGTAGVQIAKSLGAEVTGICSGRNAELVRSLGADSVIDYTTADFRTSGEQYDVIYDTLGISSFGQCKQSLTEKGVYMSPRLGFALLVDLLVSRLFLSKKAKFDATGLLPAETLRVYLAEIVDLVEAGQLRVVIDKRYPLEEAVAAHRYVDSGRKRGNVVLVAH
ncbi:MAG: NAD(P)-dependent alcohol dehydrogenase [Bacteroidota bacterium]